MFFTSNVFIFSSCSKDEKLPEPKTIEKQVFKTDLSNQQASIAHQDKTLSSESISTKFQTQTEISHLKQRVFKNVYRKLTSDSAEHMSTHNLPISSHNSEQQFFSKKEELNIAPSCSNEESFHQFSFWIGSGFNYLNYIQTSASETESGNFSDQTLSALSVGADVYINHKSKFDFQYNQVSGKISTQGETILDKTDLIRKSTAIDFQYLVFQKEQNSYTLLFGLNEHHIPILSTDYEKSLVNLLDNQLLTASFGVKYKRKYKSHFNYEANLNYQKLISAKSLNRHHLQVNPKFIFDGSLGVSRNFDSGFYLGLYWSIQSLDFEYEITRSSNTSKGSEKILDSNIQLRLGWDIL